MVLITSNECRVFSIVPIPCCYTINYFCAIIMERI